MGGTRGSPTQQIMETKKKLDDLLLNKKILFEWVIRKWALDQQNYLQNIRKQEAINKITDPLTNEINSDPVRIFYQYFKNSRQMQKRMKFDNFFFFNNLDSPAIGTL